MINARLSQLRELMSKDAIDVYLIPTDDFHKSEYVCDYFKTREFISGFTGSAGTLAITKEEAILWTDGRYFIQAENQLKDTDIQLYKMGQEGVPTVSAYLMDRAHLTLAFDGKVVAATMGLLLEEAVLKQGGKIIYTDDLVDKIWKDRPTMPQNKAFLLGEQYTGRSAQDKINWLKETMKSHAQVMVLSALDEIAWLFNLRGSDVLHTPVVYAYAIITLEATTLYVDKVKLDETIVDTFNAIDVQIKAYNQFYKDIETIEDKKVWGDFSKLNYAIKKGIQQSNTIHDKRTPLVLAKACKNDVELSNVKEAHLKDGVAMVRFIKWLKENIKMREITEIEAADYLAQCRKEVGAFDLSFNTICGYNANAAMMHYSATPDNHAVMKNEGMVLVDSGGQYLQGTTDITRTIALGKVDALWKKYNTTVLKGMINLSRAKFLYGATGLSLDILARGPVWQLDIDYQCGTGHGIGFVLGVHEGPHGIRWNNPLNTPLDALQSGMIVTNEPGIYLAGELGIRIENELVVRKGEKNHYGQFMHFETITFCPIDVELIDIQYLNDEELVFLNHYHQEVYDQLHARLTEEEASWLYQVTRPLGA